MEQQQITIRMSKQTKLQLNKQVVTKQAMLNNEVLNVKKHVAGCNKTEF